MIKIISQWLLVALSLLAAAYILPGITVTTFWVALIVAVLLAFVNLIFRPILVVLTLPINIVTLGLFTFIINGFLFWLLALVVEGFDTANFWWAVLGALVVSAFSFLGNKLIDKVDE